MSRRTRVVHSDLTNNDSVEGAKNIFDKMDGVDSSSLEEKKARNLRTEKRLPDLRDLIFLGRTSKIVKIGDFEIEMTSLSHEEKREIVLKVKKLGADFTAYIKEETLAYGIRSINGVPLSELYETYGGQEELSDRDKKLFIINKFQSSLVDRLIIEHSKLSEESDKIMGLNSDEEEEVREDIKK